MKLDFIVPGFSKCGTTTLCAMLAEHPEIGIPDPSVPDLKEPGFFANYFDLGWQWYQDLFLGVAGKRFVGDGSTIYSTAEYAESASARIVEHFPEIRLIFIARHPIRRLESSYREMHHNGHNYGIDVPHDLDQALRTLPNMIKDTLYWQRINTFRQRIPDARILVLFLEDFERNPAIELAKCFEFLGADPTVRIERLDRRLNSGALKQRDSRALQFLKSHPLAKACWNRLSRKPQEFLVNFLNLREPFRDTIHWPPSTLDWVRDQIAEDAQSFLKFYGKSCDFWDLKQAHLQDEISNRNSA